MASIDPLESLVNGLWISMQTTEISFTREMLLKWKFQVQMHLVRFYIKLYFAYKLYFINYRVSYITLHFVSKLLS